MPEAIDYRAAAQEAARLNGQAGLAYALEHGLWFIAGEQTDRFEVGVHLARLADGSDASIHFGEETPMVDDYYAYRGTALEIPLLQAFYKQLMEREELDSHEDLLALVEEDDGLEVVISSSTKEKMQQLGHISLHFMHPEDIVQTANNSVAAGGYVCAGVLNHTAEPLAIATLSFTEIDMEKVSIN